MTYSAEIPPEPKPLDSAEDNEATLIPTHDLIRVAEYLGKGREYIASVTSFIDSDLFSLDKALQMLGLSSVRDFQSRLCEIDEIRRLEELKRQRVESLQANAMQARNFGGMILRTLNPFHHGKH